MAFFDPVDPSTESLLWPGCVGFCIVADTGLVAALPLCLSAGPKQKSLTVADRAATRLLVRGRRSIALSCCRIALAANGEPLTRPAVIVGADVGA